MVDLIVEAIAVVLGVIAFGSHHGQTLRRCAAVSVLKTTVGRTPSLPCDGFLSRRAGAGRQLIILSRRPTQPYRFGPLNQEGGERRLNVAITRARIHLVAGFSQDPVRTRLGRHWGGSKNNVLTPTGEAGKNS